MEGVRPNGRWMCRLSELRSRLFPSDAILKEVESGREALSLVKGRRVVDGELS